MSTSNVIARGVLGLCCVCALFLAPATASAESLRIQYTGLNIQYDGSTITTVGGVDPLQSVDFSVDEINILSLNAPADSPLTIELSGPGVANLPVGGGSVMSAVGGSLKLALPGGDYLDLDLGAAEVIYATIGSLQLHFILGAGVGEVLGQALPLDGFVGEVSISFSTQVKGNSLTHDGQIITGFTAAGTGEIEGAQIPEPTGAAMLLGGLLACLAGFRRRG